MRILIVDDNLFAIEIIKDFFKISGVEADFDSANDGLEAQEKAAANQYDLVLLDISMPKADGLEVLKFIRSFNKEVVIIITSVVATEYEMKRVFDAGADDFLIKPIEIEKLLDAVNNLGRYRKNNDR